MEIESVVETTDLIDLPEDELSKPGIAPVVPSNGRESAEAAREHKARDYIRDVPNPHPWVLIGIR